MTHFKGSSKHHSFMQGIGQKVKYAAEMIGTVKTGFNLAKGAYTLFETVAPILPMIL